MLSMNDYFIDSDVAYRRERITRDWAAANHHGSTQPHRRWLPTLRRRPTVGLVGRHNGRATVS